MFHHMPLKYNYSTAIKTCLDKGSSWALPDCRNHTDILVNVMKQKGLREIWTSIHKVEYEQWTWVNNATCN